MSSTPVSPDPEPHTHVRPAPGESAPFHLTSQWQIDRPAVQVWEEFQDIARWPAWWPGVRGATVLDSAETGA